MNLPKYAVAGIILGMMTNAGVAFAQLVPPPPPPPPAPAPVVTEPIPVAVAPAPVALAPAPVEVAPAPVAAPTPTLATPATRGNGKKNGMDNGKKLGLYKDHANNHDHDKHLNRMADDDGDNDRHTKHENHRKHGDNNDKIVLVGTVDGNTFTVTDISSGHLAVGTTLSSNGTKIKIIGLVTGRGGVGTYTVTTSTSDK